MLTCSGLFLQGALGLFAMGIVAMMAPRKDGKVKTTAIKQEKEFPAIPTDELNKMNASLRYKAAHGDAAPLEEYKACRTLAEKRQWYYTKYQYDKKCTFVRREDVKLDVKEHQKEKLTGWVTKWKIAQLKGILPGVPNYEQMVEACVAGLESRKHEDQGLASMGELQYNCVHQDMERDVEKDINQVAIKGSAEILAASHDRVLSDLHFGNSAGSGDVVVAEWKQGHMEMLAKCNKELKEAQKLLQEAKGMELKLKCDEESVIGKTVCKELADKYVIFESATQVFAKLVSTEASKGNAVDQAAESVADLKPKMEHFAVHVAQMSKYIKRVKPFCG